jgi:hypothetical protein
MQQLLTPAQRLFQTLTRQAQVGALAAVAIAIPQAIRRD